MAANPFKSMFSRVFGAKATETVVLDERQRGLLVRVVDFIVDNTDPRIRLVAGYQDKLAPAVIRSAQYLGGLIRSLPEPLELSREAWGNELSVNAFFATPDDVPQVLARGTELRAFFDDPRHGGAQEAFALMVMEKSERTVYGTALENGILKSDVAQVNVNFSAHRIVAPAATKEDARIEIGLRGVRRLLDVVLARIAAIQQQAADLAERRAFLGTRLRMLKSAGFGIEPAADHRREIAEIEAQIARDARELQEIKGTPRTMEGYIAQIGEVMLVPEQHLTMSEVRLRVSRLGIKVAADSPEPSHELVLTELRLGELCAIAVPVRCKRSDLPAQRGLLAGAEKYL
ncbi:MAG: hypothetical protein IH606_10395 [Burkholderiales bacterium]|nr:hypothetical protein [Burkholderiales bacterium]